MPTNKDLKRLVRARMRKTGEAYTTARAQLLRKPIRKKTAAQRPDYAVLAGMSDEAVEAKTGRTWGRWVTALDGAKAATWPHREIARYVADTYDVSGWWAQTITVGYERIKGLRDIGQRRSGTYDASKSKTIGVPIAKLYKAFSVKRTRMQWLPNGDLTIRTSTREKSMRITWGDGTSVEVHFTRKGPAKSLVSVQHRKLPTKAALHEMKAYWGERLAALAELLVETHESVQ